MSSVIVVKEFEVSFGRNEAPENEETEVTEEKVDDAPGIEIDDSVTYYGTETGGKIHTDPECAGENSYQITDFTGLTPCEKCTKHLLEA